MIIIGICGASGSGKSTLAQRIEDSLKCRCYVLGQDCYYYDHSSLPFEQRIHLNYDKPDSFNHDELLQDIQALQAKKPIQRKAYDYVEHKRADTDYLIDPPDVLILEGIHVFHDPRLCEKMHLKAYMHVDVDVCLLRRVKRDIQKRGRSIDMISEQYLSTVKPMFEKYITRYLYEADFAVIGGGFNARALDVICAYIKLKLPQKRRRLNPYFPQRYRKTT